ncbi:MAG TPA: hypothetical protein VFN75_01535 [Pseudonocardiaceae bacterium]|nr:hypothetical protein [Pseudonocardiaceae bacterium]
MHLNGYKIANPTVLARIPDSELPALLTGYGHEPFFVDIDTGDDPMVAHRRMAQTLDRIVEAITGIRDQAEASAANGPADALFDHFAVGPGARNSPVAHVTGFAHPRAPLSVVGP